MGVENTLLYIISEDEYNTMSEKYECWLTYVDLLKNTVNTQALVVCYFKTISPYKTLTT